MFVPGPSGLYRGYLTTVLREIPFSLIQFPLWEWLKRSWSNRQQRRVDPLQSAACGALVRTQNFRKPKTKFGQVTLISFRWSIVIPNARENEVHIHYTLEWFKITPLTDFKI